MLFFRSLRLFVVFVTSLVECRSVHNHWDNQLPVLELGGSRVSLRPSTTTALIPSDEPRTGAVRDGNPNSDDALHGVKKDANRTLSKLKTLHKEGPAQFSRDVDTLRQKFLPNFHPKPRTLPSAAFILVVSVVWFVIYFRSIYIPDREESLHRWQQKADAVGVNVPDDTDDIMPDMVFVFHHPRHEYDDRTAEVARETLGKVLQLKDQDEEFTHLHALKKRARGGSTMAHFKSGIDDVREAVVTGVGTMRARMESPRSAKGDLEAQQEKKAPEGETCPQQLNKADVRVAFLMDFCDALPKWGFSVKVRSSIDDDELFVCVTLDNPEAVSLFLERRQAALQVQESLTSKLGITYHEKPHVQSPPYIQYDLRTVERLHKEAVLAENNPLELYKSYHGRIKDGCVLSSHDSIRIIFQELSRHIDVDAAVEAGFLVKWYAVHNSHRVSQLRLAWSNFKHLADLRFVQPIPFIKEYFGSRVAFMFAWNGLQCKALLALVPISLMCLLFCAFEEGKGLESGQILGFNAALITWSVIANNQWEREEAYFKCLWDDGKEERLVRPQFVGEMLPSMANANIKEKQYSPKKYATRKATSMLVTTFFCAMVALCVHIWMTLFEGKLGVVAGLCLTIQIKIFQFIYNMVADFLTDWENHKYQDDHYSSYLWKQFTFQSINNYAAFFYLTVCQARTKVGCPDDNCLPELRKQLVTTLIILSVCRIAEVIVQLLLVKFSLWCEDHQMRKAAEASAETTPKRQYIEEQAKYSQFRMKDQIQVMMQLMISLGHILVFGSVVPAVVPFCCVVYCVNLRASAFLLSNYAQRPLPRKSQGIGGWKSVDSLLRRIGVGFSGFLLVAHGTLFKDSLFIVRMSGFLLYTITMALVHACVNMFYPKEDEDAKLIVLRRTFIEKEIRERGLENRIAHVQVGSQTPNTRLSQLGIAASKDVDSIANQDWKVIPHFDGTRMKVCD